MGTPARRLLVPAAVGVVCVGVVGVLLWLLSAFAGAGGSASAADQRVSATVVKSADCANQNAHDLVSFTVGGQKHQTPLNACGNQAGQALTVLVPTDLTASTVVNPADAAPANPVGQTRRVAFLLLVLATAASGACAYYLYRHQHPGATVTAGAADSTADGALDPAPRPKRAAKPPKAAKIKAPKPPKRQKQKGEPEPESSFAVSTATNLEIDRQGEEGDEPKNWFQDSSGFPENFDESHGNR